MLQGKNTITGALIFTAVFVVVCITRYTDFLFMLPYGIHEEAQTDRLALAIQFYDRGMNFSLPRTYNLYPVDAITGVEFPIHSYTAALLGKVVGREYIPTCFRLLTLLITYAGLLALYLGCFRLTKNFIASLFVPLFLFCSPSFAYYACTTMPDAAAGSISFIGIYFFLKYYEQGQFRLLLKAIIFLTLAALVKTSVGIVLLGAMGYTLMDGLFIKGFVHKTDLRRIIVLFACSLGFIVAYYFYNQYLTHTFGSYIFVLRVLPFENWDAVKLYFGYSITRGFLNQYFIAMQYPVLALLTVCGAAVLVRQKDKRRLLWLPAILLVGCLSCTFIFGNQLIHHDYYFVSMWLPSLTIISLIFFTGIYTGLKARMAKQAFTIVSIVVLAGCLFLSHKMVHARIALDEHYYPGVKQINGSSWMHGGDKILDKLGIGRDSTIFVLDEIATNTGLVYFDRRGKNAAPLAWRGNLFNVRDYMKERDIRIMVCNAEKMPEIKSTYAQDFDVIFKELYIDANCGVYYLKF